MRNQLNVLRFKYLLVLQIAFIIAHGAYCILANAVQLITKLIVIFLRVLIADSLQFIILGQFKQGICTIIQVQRVIDDKQRSILIVITIFSIFGIARKEDAVEMVKGVEAQRMLVLKML
ncbi:Hypothetical_protein [Hexamita inflata]|uniref:Hypothetical_protein n=1 Tax=Hexamita inflata TaxID=28002 RepID=A0AA86UWR8_9EUKA|nr:Hypothetical protein HINF_LOCUS55412 [Hexamita inflata]